MWQRFTERARKVIFYAQEEALRHGENYVSTEHLLLGLVREHGSVAAEVLSRVSVSLNRIRAEVEKQLPHGEARPSQDVTLTPRAKRVIDLSYDEARNLGNNYIGTEHLLLGLVREGDGLAGRVLAKLNVTLEPAREIVKELHVEHWGKSEGKPVPERTAEHKDERLLVLKQDAVPPVVAVLLIALADPRSSLVKFLERRKLWPRDIQCVLENSVLAADVFPGPSLDECLVAASALAQARGARPATSADMFVAFLELSDSWSVGEYLAANECDLEEIKKALGGS